MKKTIAIICLLSSVLGPLVSPAATNAYLDITVAELNRRLSVVTNIEPIVTNLNIAVASFTNNAKTTVLSAGLSDIAFVNSVVNTAFTGTDTDIDLSGYVGTNSAVVLLRVKDNTGSANDVLFQPNGEATEVGLLDGVSGSQIDANKLAYIVVTTSSSGVIEATVDGSCHITLVAFIRRHVFD